jgi:hypothetical protein
MSVIMNVLNTVRQENQAVEDRQQPKNDGKAIKETSQKIERETVSKETAPDYSGISINAKENQGTLSISRPEAAGKNLSLNFGELSEAIRNITSKFQSKTGATALMYLLTFALIVFSVFQVWNACSINPKSSAMPAGMTKISNTKTNSMAAHKNIENRQILQGIILDEKDPYCLISNELYRLGDTWNGYKIMSISATGVTLVNNKSENYFLQNHVKKDK